MLELSSPIRLYWDFLPNQPADDFVSKTCADVVALRFLSIHLQNSGQTLSPGTIQAIDQLTGPGRALLLSTTPSAACTLDGAAASRLRQLFVQVTTAADIAQVAEIHRELSPLVVGISLVIPEIALTALPELLRLAIAAGIPDVHFPMQRLTSGVPCWSPPLAELTVLTAQLQKRPLPASLRLSIHDPFLWRAIHAQQPFPDGGCQAANTMLYLAPNGEVYSCPLVPVSLGNLYDQSLQEIANSCDKRALRNIIREVPPGCIECPDFSGCRCGCRGRAFVMHGWSAPDPVCGR